MNNRSRSLFTPGAHRGHQAIWVSQHLPQSPVLLSSVQWIWCRTQMTGVPLRWYDPVPALHVKRVWEDNHLTTNTLEAEAALKHCPRLRILTDPHVVPNFIFFFHLYLHLADTFIQSNLQMRTTEAIKTNKRAIICKCYGKSRLALRSTLSK